MARHLDYDDIEGIVRILDGWTEKLTWDKLCEAAKRVTGRVYARQTLCKHVRIQDAYEGAKKRYRERDPPAALPPSIRVASQRIAQLTNSVKRFDEENQKLLQQFVTWQYNAAIAGLSLNDLNRPLPTIDRHRSDSGKK